MRTLVIVRHGSYSGSTLNEIGREQIQRIRDALGELRTGAIILSSNAGRALESAQILGEDIGITPVAYADLYSDGDTAYDILRAFALAVQHGTDAETVIIVTHHEIIARLPAYVGQQFRFNIPYSPLSRGCGVVIDLAAKTYRYIP